MFWSNRKKDKVELKYAAIHFNLKPIGFSKDKFKSLLEKAGIDLIEECEERFNDCDDFVCLIRIWTPITNRGALLKQLKKHGDMIDVKSIREESFDYSSAKGSRYMHIWGAGFASRDSQVQYVKQGLSWLA